MNRFALLFFAACSSASSTAETTPATDAGTTDSLDSGSSTTHRASAELLRCAIGRTALGSITDTVTRINALLPVDGPCIVAALPRPLSVIATTGQQSVQPAIDAQSPRIFFLLPKLVVAVVPGPSKLVEFGEWATTTRTIKGELALPVTETLASDAAFQHVINAQGIATRCASCHTEERSTTIPKAFVSTAFQPQPDEVVTVAQLSAMHDTCTQTNDPSDRCRMFHAIFDVGAVVDGAFDPSVAYFR